MAPVRVLSMRAVNRALLARQLLLERQALPAAGPGRAAQVVRTIEHLVGLQAQAPFPPYYGLWSPLGGFRPEDLASLITNRSVVRVALMRGTNHPVRRYRLIRAGSGSASRLRTLLGRCFRTVRHVLSCPQSLERYCRSL